MYNKQKHKKQLNMLLLCLVLIFHPNIAQDDFYGNDDYPVDCDYYNYNTVEDDHGCHHKKFPYVMLAHPMFLCFRRPCKKMFNPTIKRISPR